MWTGFECLRLGSLCAGINNIERIYNCFTRVHIQIKDLEKVTADNQEALKKLPYVKGLLIRGDELQLITGTNARELSETCKKYLNKQDPYLHP